MVQKNSLKKIIVIAGPTASGKSDLAQDLALKIGGEIINADSQQFYKGFDVGTGKLKPSEIKVPHHLLDICSIDQKMDAMSFVNLADQAIQDIQNRDLFPIIVGGTGLYLKALLYGLDPLPKSDPKLREKLEKEIESRGLDALYQLLIEIDPYFKDKISKNDKLRIVRNLEIYYLSKQKPSSLFSTNKVARYEYELFILSWPRPILHKRIEARINQMIQEGWADEVACLVKENQQLKEYSLPIGYTDILNYLSGSLSKTELIQSINLKTRQYAKRQDTWFRKMVSGQVIHLSEIINSKIIDNIIELIDN